MRLRLIVCGAALALAPLLMALTPNLPAGTLRKDMIVETRTGPVNCIVAAPRPAIMPARAYAHGVYAADISISTGYVYSVRILQSSGDSALDNAVLNILSNWRFRPRMIYKLIVPVDFTKSGTQWGER